MGKGENLMKFRSKPVEIEANQWFKNGDHPQDDCRTINPVPGDGEPFQSEGKVVRYFRHPAVSGKSDCKHCDQVMHVHGWIDTIQGGHTVCPSDWIIAEPIGTGFYPCKDEVFQRKYEAVEK
jgi:hypothetical protein